MADPPADGDADRLRQTALPGPLIWMLGSTVAHSQVPSVRSMRTTPFGQGPRDSTRPSPLILPRLRYSVTTGLVLPDAAGRETTAPAWISRVCRRPSVIPVSVRRVLVDGTRKVQPEPYPAMRDANAAESSVPEDSGEVVAQVDVEGSLEDAPADDGGDARLSRGRIRGRCGRVAGIPCRCGCGCRPSRDGLERVDGDLDAGRHRDSHRGDVDGGERGDLARLVGLDVPDLDGAALGDGGGVAGEVCDGERRPGACADADEPTGLSVDHDGVEVVVGHGFSCST